MPVNVLVTGAGLLLGQGILRCLRQSTLPMSIHTADPEWRSSGHWLGDKAHLIPFASDAGYMDKIIQIIESEKIHIMMIGSDAELLLFAKQKYELEKNYNIKIIVSPEEVIHIANNKWLTAEFLKKHHFPYPKSILSSNKKQVALLKKEASYPYFAKPINGSRSKGITTIFNEQMLDEIVLSSNNLVIQEYLPDDAEYTSGCIVYERQCQAIVTLKRDLRDGNTYRAYYDKTCGQFDDYIKQIAELLPIEGPCNFQFRIRDGKPVVFEINSRFSGTTPLRSMFGFNEVHAILDYVLNNNKISQPILREGVVMRSWSDIFVTQQEANKLIEQGWLTNPHCENYPFYEE